MRFRVFSFAAVLPVLLLVASPLAAQSLADVAKKEEARRADVSEPARTLTNADLTPDPTGEPVGTAPRLAAALPPGTVSAAGPSDGGPGDSSPTADGAAGEPAAEAAEEKTLDEAHWRGQANRLKGRIGFAREALAKVDKPSASQDPRELDRMARLVKAAERLLSRADDAWRLFVMQADAAKVPGDWLK